MFHRFRFWLATKLLPQSLDSHASMVAHCAHNIMWATDTTGIRCRWDGDNGVRYDWSCVATDVSNPPAEKTELRCSICTGVFDAPARKCPYCGSSDIERA